jgi:hypothetical protein
MFLGKLGMMTGTGGLKNSAVYKSWHLPRLRDETDYDRIVINKPVIFH